MIIGMSVAAFTVLHVVISIIGIVSGVVVLVAMLKGKAPAGWTALFLVTTVLTSATGFLFPATGFTPARGSASFRWCCSRRRCSRFTYSTSPAPGAGSMS